MHYVISDVHGCVYTLSKLIDRVRFADESPEFIFVGDYIDRGKHSKESVDYVIDMQKQGAICLRGNHDDVIDWLLNDQCASDMKEHVRGEPNIEKVYDWWMWNGLDSTLLSYNLDLTANGSTVISNWREQIDQSHKNFFRSLQLYWENETHFACHAFMRPNEELPRSLKFLPSDRVHETLWSRFTSGSKHLKPIETMWDRIGVFGHTPTTYYNLPTPIKYGKIRLIDTGAFTGNYMCAYCCEQDDWILQATDPEDLT